MAESGLGPIENLVGKWEGTGNGWNIIAVPLTPSNATAPVSPGTTENAALSQFKVFQLEVQRINETMTISSAPEISNDEAPNKGGDAGQQESFGLEYDLIVNEVNPGDPHNRPAGPRLHFENGMWLNLTDPNSANPNPIVRQACVPHGNTVQMMGTATFSEGGPKIGIADTTPINLKTGAKETGPYLDPYNELEARVLPQLFNPNQTLIEAIDGQKIKNTWTFDVSTANNGGITNIPFGNSNAKAISWGVIVWIETLENGSIQMQYSQTIMIDFAGVRWPHVVVNTLRKQS